MHYTQAGNHAQLTILFADVRGSTAMAERMSPAAFKDQMSRFYSVATDVLIRAEALLDKIVGDEVGGLFLPIVAGRQHARIATAFRCKFCRPPRSRRELRPFSAALFTDAEHAAWYPEKHMLRVLVLAETTSEDQGQRRSVGQQVLAPRLEHDLVGAGGDREMNGSRCFAPSGCEVAAGEPVAAAHRRRSLQDRSGRSSTPAFVRASLAARR